MDLLFGWLVGARHPYYPPETILRVYIYTLNHRDSLNGSDGTIIPHVYMLNVLCLPVNLFTLHSSLSKSCHVRTIFSN